MTSRLRDQNGFTLIELLLVMVLSLMVLGGTLATFNTFERGERRNQLVNEQIERTRDGLDLLARELRNLARPGATVSGFGVQPSIWRAEPFDFVFQTSAPQRTWVRYCLAQSGTYGPTRATRDSGVIFASESPGATLSGSMTGGCPGTGWATRRIVASSVANDVGGRGYPIFSFTCRIGTDCATNNRLQVKGVRADVFVDLDPAAPPKEERLSTGVFLRNQNEPPTAEFSMRPNGPGSVTLNASSSEDPEGRTLQFFWFLSAVPTGWTCGQQVPNGTNYLPGVTATVTGVSGSTVNVTLVTCDAGNLPARQGPVAVRLP
jgi:prepilin-type N-terminal cleavage/methylation domain-containing protein